MTRRFTTMWMGASIGLVATAGAGVATRATRQPTPHVTTVAVTRGDLVRYVSATGSLEALTTVNVGIQVSGTVQALYADFNDLVRKGQTLARLDPSLFRTQVEQARANLARAEAEVERLKVARDDARLTLNRTKRLADKQLVSAMELETAQVAQKSTDAQVRSAEASVAQSRASLNQARVNLAQTIVSSPIDGIVISRAVDSGQTVAASMQAPTLFVLAADLTRMRVNANIDESDVGDVTAGQPVSFRVDAYPNETFTGRVAQVRLQAVVSQNVVTYATVIDVENPGLKLKPGMTATVSIEVARSSNALQVPNATLRVRPSAAALASLGGPTASAGSQPAGTTPACDKSQDCATLWLFDGTTLRSLGVRTGVTDGMVTEVVGAGLMEGEPVVSAISVPATSAKVVTSTATASSPTRSPLFGASAPPPPVGMGGPR